MKTSTPPTRQHWNFLNLFDASNWASTRSRGNHWLRSFRPGVWILGILPIAICVIGLSGCQKAKRDRSDAISQRLAEAKTKTNELRNAMRHLAEMDPTNRANIAKAIRLELNTWLKTVDPTAANYQPPKILNSLPTSELAAVGCETPTVLEFDNWDVDYLYGTRMMQQLSQWIVSFPIRDKLLGPMIEAKSNELPAADALKLLEAFKLFDWTMRNVALSGEPSSSVEQSTRDPRTPILDSGIGYGYLPWETLLYSRGDFVERGRVFSALAQQRNIDTFWISVGAAPEVAGELFAIGVLIADQVFLFEPKLGMPLIEPDEKRLVTLAEVRDNPRILKRLDVVGKFDYKFEASDIRLIQSLIDLPPVAGSARMQLLDNALLGDERMVAFVDLDGLQSRISAALPDAHVTMWWTPLLAQLQAASVRERLLATTPFTLGYMGEHGVWLVKNPASRGRLLHLAGDFEKTMDQQGALSMYMDTRVDELSIQRLAYDPTVQRELGVSRMSTETKEAYEARVLKMQYIFTRAKLDAGFLLAQLHFDLGNFDSAKKWLKKRVLDVPQAEVWHSLGWYTLARTCEELGETAEAEEALTHLPTSMQLNPSEPGNRLRLRLLRNSD